MRSPLLLALLLFALPTSALAETLELGEPVVMRGAAVAETPQGLVGSTATFTVTAAKNGSGHVFLDTFPLTQVDMQGSARLAARVAAQVSGKPLASHDLFFVIRSNSVQIGGPSAGATLTVGALAALNGWAVRPDVMMTGTIEPDGSVGPVGGIPEKARAASEAGMKRFLFPAGEETTPLSTGGRVDVRDYCRAQLSLECLPVADIYAAVENMTDHAFVRPPLVGDVTGAAFRARLGPLSGDLIDAARTTLREAQAAFDAVRDAEGRAALRPGLDDARAILARAESASANGTYYTAASLSFQASIAAHDVRDRARLVVAADPAQALVDIIDAARADVAATRRQVQDARVDDAAAFESVAAAQIRLLEAEVRFATADALLRNGTDPGRAIYEAAYASERAETATWWLRLGNDIPGGASIDASALSEAAIDAISAGAEHIAYVEAVFGARAPTGSLDAARARLASAESALGRGFYAAAMLEAFEAQVRASNALLLASFGRVPPERLESARLEAGRAIQEARGRGAEPLLAQSQYEFALSLEDGVDRLTFLGLARMSANLAGVSEAFGRSTSLGATRFQGLPERPSVSASVAAALFVVGIALGTVMMLLLAPRRGAARAPRDLRPAPRAAMPPHPTVVEPADEKG